MIDKPMRRKFLSEGIIHRYFFRPLAQELMLLIWNTNLTPNQITFFRMFLFFPFAAGILFYGFYGLIISFFIFILMEILDHLDGMLAREKKLSTKRGQFYELISDDLTASPTLFFGLVLVFSSLNYYLLNYFLLALAAERVFLYCVWNFNTDENVKVLKEINHDLDFVNYSGSFVNYSKHFLVGLFVWKPLILLICKIIDDYFDIMFCTPAMFVYITSVWIAMSLKRIYTSWKVL